MSKGGGSGCLARFCLFWAFLVFGVPLLGHLIGGVGNLLIPFGPLMAAAMVLGVLALLARILR